MVLFNYSTRELTAKIVYYGPGLCGKTTNLQFVYKTLPENIRRGKMLSLATKTDRTLFFDFLPIDLGRIRGLRTRIQLYTVPGQVFYNSTRKLVLKGADGVVFVADSQKRMTETNNEAFQNLEENLRELGMELKDLPLVLQFNKRDLSDLSTVEEMNSTLNRYNAPFYESVATTGIGVEDTLKAVIKLVLGHLSEKYNLQKESSRKKQTVAAPAVPVPAEPMEVPAETDQPDTGPGPELTPAASVEPETDETVLDLDAPEIEDPLDLEPEPEVAANPISEPMPDSGMTQAIPTMQAMGVDADEQVFDLGDAEIVPPSDPPSTERPTITSKPASAGTEAGGQEFFSELGEGEVDSALDGVLSEPPGEMVGAGLEDVSAPTPPPGMPMPEPPAIELSDPEPAHAIAPVAVQLALRNGGEVAIPLEVQLEGKTVRYRLRMSLEVLVEDPASRN
jgi:signal recognition particle receptor subunit beta